MPVPDAVYAFDWRVDGPVVAITAGWGATAEFVELLPPRPPESAPSLNPLDQAALSHLVGLREAGRLGEVAGPAAGSNALAGAALLLPAVPLVAGLATPGDSRSGTWRSMAGIAWESASIALAGTDVVKLAVARERPYTAVCGQEPSCYDEFGESPVVTATDGTVRVRQAAQVSFLSGHTAVVAASSFSLAEMYAATHRDQPWGLRVAVPWGLATLATAGTGLLRVEAGQHYPSDVVAGAIFGAAVGLGVPVLHRRSGGVAHLFVGECGAETPCALASGTW